MPSASSARKGGRRVKLGSAASSKRSVRDDAVSLEQLWTYREVLKYAKPSYPSSSSNNTGGIALAPNTTIYGSALNIDLKTALNLQPLKRQPPNRTNTPTPRRWHSHGSLDTISNYSNGGLNKGYIHKPVFLDDHHQCKVERRRQETYESYMKMPTTVDIARKMAAVASGDNDNNKLPVVELKPFITSTKREWRPSKSWAESLEFDESSGGGGSLVSRYQNPFVSNSDANAAKPTLQHQSSQESVVQQAYYDQMGYPAPNKLTPRVPEGPCVKAFAVANERVLPHPKQKDLTDGIESNRESFVTKLEREKSTTDGIIFGANSNVPTSFTQRSLTDLDIQTQTDIRVKGKRYRKLPEKKANIYYEPWQVYKMKRAKGGNTEHQQSSQHDSKTTHSGVGMEENESLDRNIYDYFDRTTVLPALTVKSAKAKKTRSRSSKSLYIKSPEPGQRAVTPARSHSGSGYRLGVVNSLDVMSMCGRPLGLEQTLTKTLKSTIHQLKRTKDAGFLQYATPVATRNPPPNPKIDIGGAPTIGEMMLSQGRMSNAPSSYSRCTSKRSGALASKSAHSQRDAILSRATTYWPDSGFESNTVDARTISPSKSLKSSAQFVKLSQHPGDISPELDESVAPGPKPQSTATGERGKLHSRMSSAGGAPQVPNSSARSTGRFPVPPVTQASAMKQRDDTLSSEDSVDLEMRGGADSAQNATGAVLTNGIESRPQNPPLSKPNTPMVTFDEPTATPNDEKQENDITTKDIVTVGEGTIDASGEALEVNDNMERLESDVSSEKRSVESAGKRSVHSIDVVIPQENADKRPKKDVVETKKPPKQEDPVEKDEKEKPVADIPAKDGKSNDDTLKNDTENKSGEDTKKEPNNEESHDNKNPEAIITLDDLEERNKVVAAEKQNDNDSGAALDLREK